MFFLYCSLSSQDYSVIDALRNRIEKLLSAHSRANTFVFGDVMFTTLNVSTFPQTLMHQELLSLIFHFRIL